MNTPHWLMMNHSIRNYSINESQQSLMIFFLFSLISVRNFMVLGPKWLIGCQGSANGLKTRANGKILISNTWIWILKMRCLKIFNSTIFNNTFFISWTLLRTKSCIVIPITEQNRQNNNMITTIHEFTSSNHSVKYCQNHAIYWIKSWFHWKENWY